MSDNMNIIREIRLQRGLTLHQLAEKMAVSPSTLEKVEKGQRRLKTYFLETAAQSLSVDKHRLANGQLVDVEARVVGPIRKPSGEDLGTVVQSIPMYGAFRGAKVKESTLTYIANIPDLYHCEGAFAVQVGDLGERYKNIPWFRAGCLLYCHPTAYVSENSLCVIRSDGDPPRILGHLVKRDDCVATVESLTGEVLEAELGTVYSVVQVKITTI
jgi:transcriptional regulator with XRE-family HTH domain